MSVLLGLVLLHGVVMRGPITPVCQVGKSCSEPAVGVKLAFARAGRTVFVRTVSGGRYSVRLVPGTYLVRVVPAQRIGSGIAPRQVRVRRAARIDFAIDTGIR